MVTSASAPTPRCPLRDSPSIRAGPARVMIAISARLYCRSRSLSRRPFADSRRQGRDDLAAIGAVHQEADDLGVGEERSAVGMVSAHRDPPRIVDAEIPLQPDGPLPGVDQARVLVFDRRDAAAGLLLDVIAVPLRPVQPAQVIADRPVGGHPHRPAEDDLADVHGQVRMRVEVIGEWPYREPNVDSSASPPP